MTVQMSDRVLVGDVNYAAGILPLPTSRLTTAPDDGSLNHTACWRRYIATWALRDGGLWLDGIQGRYALPDGKPLVATWVSGVLRFLTGGLEDDPLPGRRWHERRHLACREFEIRDGRIRRERRLDAPCDATSAVWEELSEGRRLFAVPVQRVVRDIFADLPRLASFRLRRLRDACARQRQVKGLSPGDVAEAMGHARTNGAKLVEWERGLRDRPEDWIARLCQVQEIDEQERATLRLMEDNDHAAALVAYQAVPVRPLLVIEDAFIGTWRRTFVYEAPEDVATGDEDAARAWAADCARLTWRSAILMASRKSILAIDSQGAVTGPAVISDD